MNKQQILQLAQSDPKFTQAIQAIRQQMQDDITPENVEEYVKMLEFAINHPDKWAQIRAAAIKDGLADPQDLPEKADPVFLVSILIALYGLQQQLGSAPKAPAQPQAQQPPAFARGGLAQAARKLQSHGRNGDTMLAHITPREAMMLRQSGGSGTINPATGLPEYFSWRKLLKVVAPIALSFLAPGLGTAIGSALGASAAWAPVVGSAIMGAGSAAVSGGNILQGALLGGLTGGLGGQIGGAANNALNLGLGQTGQAILGGSLAGGIGGMATGQGFLKGAVSGGVGTALGNMAGSMGTAGTTAGNMLQQGGQQFGNMMAAGYDAKQAAVGGVGAGLAAGVFGKPEPLQKPSQTVLNQMQQNPSGIDGVRLSDELMPPAGGTPNPTPVAKPTSFMDNAAKLLPLASMLSAGSTPPQVQAAVAKLSPEQQAYFNKPSQKFDWDKIQTDANTSGLDLSRYMAQNWNQIMSGAYSQDVPRFARGGALSKVAYLANGSGAGRDDLIDAKLSDGEYVIDAETVALLGDGSNKAGAQRLDQMREAIRAHKGTTLSKGKISPNAKSPLQYLKGVK